MGQKYSTCPKCKSKYHYKIERLGLGFLPEKIQIRWREGGSCNKTPENTKNIPKKCPKCNKEYHYTIRCCGFPPLQTEIDWYKGGSCTRLQSKPKY